MTNNNDQPPYAFFPCTKQRHTKAKSVNTSVTLTTSSKNAIISPYVHLAVWVSCQTWLQTLIWTTPLKWDQIFRGSMPANKHVQQDKPRRLPILPRLYRLRKLARHWQEEGAGWLAKILFVGCLQHLFSIEFQSLVVCVYHLDSQLEFQAFL